MATATAICWSVNKADQALIDRIVFRAVAQEWVPKAQAEDFEMDLIALHRNGTPLRLADFIGADDFNFAHDVVGIRRHMDRETGRLNNHFVPRFAAPRRRR